MNLGVLLRRYCKRFSWSRLVTLPWLSLLVLHCLALEGGVHVAILAPPTRIARSARIARWQGLCAGVQCRGAPGAGELCWKKKKPSRRWNPSSSTPGARCWRSRRPPPIPFPSSATRSSSGHVKHLDNCSAPPLPQARAVFTVQRAEVLLSDGVLSRDVLREALRPFLY